MRFLSSHTVMEPVVDIHFLRMEAYHLSTPKARDRVQRELRALGIHSVTAPKAPIVLTNGVTEIRTTFEELVRQTRETGYVKPFQQERDRSDPVFGGTSALT